MKMNIEALKRFLAVSLCLCLIRAPAWPAPNSTRMPTAAAPSALNAAPDNSWGFSLQDAFPQLGLPDVRLQAGLNIVPHQTLTAPLSLERAVPAALQAALPLSLSNPASAAPATVGRPRLEQESEPAPIRTESWLLSGLRKLLGLGRSAQMFEGVLAGEAGFRPGDLPLPEGVRPDSGPEIPEAEVSRIQTTYVGESAQPGLFGRLLSLGQSEPAPAPAPVLDGNPQDEAGVEAALRKFVRDHPAEFDGISPDSLLTLSARKQLGRGGLEDVVYVNFQQHVNDVPVVNSKLHFTVQLIGGKAVVAFFDKQIFPDLAVQTAGALSDRDILASAAAKLGLSDPAAGEFLWLERGILNVNGRWRTMQLVRASVRMRHRGRPLVVHLMVAVDVQSGEAFVWDTRLAANAQGSAAGRGMRGEPVETPRNLDLLPLAHLEIKTSQGKTFYSDDQGNFTVEGDGDQPVTITVRLRGKYVTVENQAGPDPEITATAKPGEKLQIIFSPTGSTAEDIEHAIALATVYYHSTREYVYLKEKGVSHAGIESPVLAKANVEDSCNAFWDWVAINLFRSSSMCNNTARATVIIHENGHRWHLTAVKRGFGIALLAAMSSGGISEGWGDILAVLITRNPILGGGFFKDPTRKDNFIRNAKNNYQYREDDEVHKQGQAWVGGMYDTYLNLRASGMSEEEAWSLVENLFLPVVFTGVTDIPTAAQHVLMRDTRADGTAPHYKEIAAGFKGHGIILRPPAPRRGAGFQLSTELGWLERLAGGLTNLVWGNG